MNKNVEAFMKRVDPEIHEAMEGTDNYSEVAENIFADTEDVRTRLTTETGTVDIEMVAYLFSMQNQAINQLIEELQELRPSIRFITSVLLGNQEEETDE